jgi:uncharacterized protein YkwD
MDKEVVEITSRIRTNPKWLIPHLEAMVPKFDGMIYREPGQINLRTNEGVAAVHETIKFLKEVTPVCAVAWNDALMEPAKFHCNDTGPKGLTGHNSSDGTSMGGRLGKFGQFMGHCGENISYGQETALEVVIQLIVDDGVPSRGHRTNLFNPNFKVCGTFTGPHKVYNTMTTQNFAT